MSDPQERDLPPMSDDVLAPDEVAALFRDYRACLSGVEIVAKHGPGYVPDGGRTSLEEAERLLLGRRIRGLQVRYEYQGQTWCDTLIPVEGGVRIVRIRLSTGPTGA